MGFKKVTWMSRIVATQTTATKTLGATHFVGDRLRHACLVTSIMLLPVASGAKLHARTSELAKPSAKQIAFADWEVGAFFHFGLNPFTGQEHGDGQEPPSKFNPAQLDVDQWLRTAKSMGARYAVLTARHEGGFCLWPSEATDYTIANSPYQNGQGDLVRDFAQACRKHGLKVGLYHTAGFDAHEALRDYKGEIDSPLSWGTTWGKTVGAAFKADPTLRERFKRTQVKQFRELLSNYGPIDFMWSDHWDASDPEGVWRAVTLLADELQPSMVMMGPDTWVPGNETGHVVYPMWNAVNTKDSTRYSRPARTEADTSIANNYGLLETDVLTGHPLGKFWRVRECTTHSAFHYGGWFWHPDDVKHTYPRKLPEHLDLYYRTVGLGANTIINLPPDDRGLVPDDLVAAAEALGKEIRQRFDNPIANADTIQQGNVVELAWDEPQEINTVVTMENIANGQKVASYTLEAMVNGEWRELEPRNTMKAWHPYNPSPGFETIGHRKIDRVATVTTKCLRFRCLESVAEPVEIRTLAVYNCDPIRQQYEAEYPYLSGIPTIQEMAHNGVLRDMNYVGGPISLGGVSYEFGLMTCPEQATGQGIVEYDMTEAPAATGMAATVGIEDSTGGKGSCEFIVQGQLKGEEQGEWIELYRSSRLAGTDAPASVEVSFPAKLAKLRLVATKGGDNINSDHAIWADAKFTE